GVRPRETIDLGEGLVGQSAIEKKTILLGDVSPDYLTISSSLGKATRVSVVVLPVLFEGQTKAVIELATLQPFTEVDLAFLEQLTLSLGAVFNTIEATMRTERLLTQSQQLTAELQSRQIELQQTNEELGTKAKLLADQNAEVERKNAEVEQARFALEEKAIELALTSK
ncbi:GAF domain-containing protein, partial [Treponema endosymbiont of Eucomonympha sp.]